MIINVVEESKDKLTRETWSFKFYEEFGKMALVLVSKKEESRERINHPYSSITELLVKNSSMRLIPPKDVVKKLKDMLILQIQVLNVR